MRRKLRVLFASSEAYPLIKTGGLADVSGALTQALQLQDVDIKLILPAYQGVLAQCHSPKKMGEITTPQGQTCVIYQTTLPESNLKLILVQNAALFERDGGPYQNPYKEDWPDNALRFATFSHVVAQLCMPNNVLKWQPEVAHCNDWQTGLVPYYLKQSHSQVKSIFTIHNLAYQGNFHADWRYSLGLNLDDYQLNGYEFHHQLSFMKAGLHYADKITTVSPNYAKEIQTDAFGFGFQGLLSHRKQDLIGILNGIDTDEWNPETDPHLATTYSAKTITKKITVKNQLQAEFNLPTSASPLLGVVSRLAYQKGLDLFVKIVPKLLEQGCQLVVLGSGDTELEHQLVSLAKQHPQQVGVTIGYNEPLSHRIMAGVDMFIMPSRFEPCGLNQMYGLRYGTIPIVSNTGGLADSVIDYQTQAGTKATGFVIPAHTELSLLVTIEQALALYADQKAWQKLQKQAMKTNVSWQIPAQSYITAYQSLLNT